MLRIVVEKEEEKKTVKVNLGTRWSFCPLIWNQPKGKL